MHDSDMIFEPKFSLPTPYLADYFGLWSIYEAPFRSLVNRINGTNLHVHLQAQSPPPAIKQNVDGEKRIFNLTSDGIAVFEAKGPMMKIAPSLSNGTSYTGLRRQLKAARRDKDVVGAIMIGDTPGGTQRGNEDLAEDVAKFVAQKPLFFYIEDMTASAGVSIASQATKRYANNATAMYGAMGTYSVVEDSSGMAEKLGVKVHVIKAGDFKGMGADGTEITEEQLGELQRIVNRVNETYLGLIARGLDRSVDSIRSLADGRIIMAVDAIPAGLINGIQSLEQTKQELLETVSRSKSFPVNRSNTMADKTPATLQELKQTFPNSTAEWRESIQEAEKSLPEAAVAYAAHVEQKAAEEREQHKKELEEAKNATETAKPSSTLGHQPLTVQNAGGDELLESGDPLRDFDSAVRQRLPRGRQPSFEERQSAISYVARTHPQLHQAYVRECNADKGKRVQRLVDEKYEDKVAG